MTLDHRAPVREEPSLYARRLAFFGGTFDPPHIGHLIVARDVAEALDLEAVFFLPARIPPHKQDEKVSPGEIRLEMLKAALRDDDVLGASDLELRRDPPSYSVDTLRELKERIPAADLHFVIGTDQLAEFDTWKEPEEIARLAHLVVITRGGHGAVSDQGAGTPTGGAHGEPHGEEDGEPDDEADDVADDVGDDVREGVGERVGDEGTGFTLKSPVDVPFEVVPVTRIELSSTRIRRRIREGRSIRYLVPDPVRRIIEREGLYK